MLQPAVQAYLAAILPAEALLTTRRSGEAVRVRRTDAVPRGSGGRRVARDRGTGRRGPEDLSRGEDTGRGARRRHRFVGRGDAAQAGRRAVAREVPEDPRDRSADPYRGRAARRAQPRDQRSRRCVRPVLRARSLVADRVLDRRQRRGERGRRALPQVRPDGPQRSPRARRHDRRRGRSKSAAMRSTPPATTCSR